VLRKDKVTQCQTWEPWAHARAILSDFKHS